RLHHLCTETGRLPRLHRLGLPARRVLTEAPGSQAFPQGGFYVLRHGRDRCIVRCGPVGLAGAGSHDHNDQLSCELTLDGREFITDSGTYTYTRDLTARYAFRSTAAHNAIQLGGEEQNPIRVDRPWRVLADRTRSVCTTWNADDQGTVFEGRHHGFAHRPSGALCTRRIAVDAQSGEWTVADTLEGTGTEDLVWRLHLAPGEAAATPQAPGRWALKHSNAPGHFITAEVPPELKLKLSESPHSERYGEMVVRPMVLLEGNVTLPVVITLRISPGQARPGGDRA
ncbi:MAG: heparinase II/III-family protein, partial [Gemmatimonadales bacterium]